MKVFIAGGTGNVGQNLTKLLLEEGHEIVVLTRTPDRIPGMIGLPGLTLVKGNSFDYEVIRKALSGCDAVVDFALTMMGNTPLEILESETKSVVFLLQAAEEAGVKKFIYTSTVAVMGEGADEKAAIHPQNLYGAAKAAAEAYVLGFREYFEGYRSTRKVSMLRNIVRLGETFSDPAFEGGACESYSRLKDIVQKVYKNEELHFRNSDGAQWAAGKQVVQVYKKILESSCNEEIFLAVGNRFQSDVSIAETAKRLLPQSYSQITMTDGFTHDLCRSSEKIKAYFGLSFNGDEFMEEHISWLISQIRREENGEVLPDRSHDGSQF